MEKKINMRRAAIDKDYTSKTKFSIQSLDKKYKLKAAD